MMNNSGVEEQMSRREKVVLNGGRTSPEGHETYSYFEVNLDPCDGGPQSVVPS
jgi:hypothetical protein